MKGEGPKWKLCTFTIDNDKPIMIQGGAPIILNREVIGGTTSSGYGHTVGMTICFGYIPPRYASRENHFEIEMYKEVYSARLEPRRALYDPERKRIMV
jgi:glycine cleavage system aminomethyltransferase T